MPSDYQIDPVNNVVRSRAWGILTEDESRAHYESMAADPAFDATFNQLCDLRDVDEIDMSTRSIKQLAQASIFAPGVRRAFVAVEDAHFGLSRMLQAFSEFEGSRVGVFRTIEEAKEWLDLPG